MFQTTLERITNDFDLYENSNVPEHLPGGGGWGIKVFTLETLYSEHEYCRNTWSVTNTGLPLVRYLYCQLKFYQTESADYCVTFSNALPMQSSLGMYNAMQPSIHSMLPHVLIVPSRSTYKKKKPYFKFKIGPPTQLQNKWYFTQDLAKTPLLMTRVSAMSLRHFYIQPNDINTNMNITSLNVQVFQNRQFHDLETSGYWAKKLDNKTYYLYATTQHLPLSGGKLKPGLLIALTDTKNYSAGKNCQQVTGSETIQTTWQTGYLNNLGNPFHSNYLQKDYPVFLIPEPPSEVFKVGKADITTFTQVDLTHTIRYNPYNDIGTYNVCYFKSNNKTEVNWLKPDNPELTNEGLPFWILLWGFPDWHKKIKKHLHLDSNYILTLQHKPNVLIEYLVPLSQSFLEGRSPYESEGPPTGADFNTWYPQLQYQLEIINQICLAGPGTIKLPPQYTEQALMRYKFYFKWGGSPAPMSTIEDPLKQNKYVVPGNQYATNSLQNPTADPETILWSFDERRSTITPRAFKRLQKDKSTEKTIVTGGSHFEEYTPLQQETTSEESSEEEEETLYNKLQQQQLKQRRIKQRILKIVHKLQNLE